MKNILFLSIVMLLVSSCEKPKSIIDYLPKYGFFNNSGVKVAVVSKGESSYIRDSVVIENGQYYFWNTDEYSLPITEKKTDLVMVYFNEIIYVQYVGDFDPNIRDPRSHHYYEYKKDDRTWSEEYGRWYSVYTFTEEDYQKALELNKLVE